MDLQAGSLMQIFINNSNNNSTNNSRSYWTPQNIAVSTNLIPFINGNITISRNTDKICPEFIVFDLYESETSLTTLYNLSKNIIIELEIGSRKLISFPINLLWNLKTPEILENKLYINFPFNQFFGAILLHSLDYHQTNFRLLNFNNLVNYVSSCCLICKSYIYGNRNQLYDPSYNIIQQISSLEVKVSDVNNDSESDTFVLNTTEFKGLTKGFFIQTQNIEDLKLLQFYINGLLRFNYNKFFIRNNCIKINNNLIYFPFNNN